MCKGCFNEKSVGFLAKSVHTGEDKSRVPVVRKKFFVVCALLRSFDSGFGSVRGQSVCGPTRTTTVEKGAFPSETEALETFI